MDYARRGGVQGSAPLDEIRAMVLFDLVGDCDLQLPYEPNSDLALYALFAASAAELDGDPAPFELETASIDDDHVPFLEAGIPAVDLIDFTYGPGAPPGRLLAHGRRHARQGLPREPRDGGGDRPGGDPRIR